MQLSVAILEKTGNKPHLCSRTKTDDAMKKFIFAILLALAPLHACSDKEDYPWNRPAADEYELTHGQIVLGEQLKDPYSVENMTKALLSVYPAAAGRSHIDPTDYYVRFLPKNEEQVQQLLDMELLLLDHPLDYRIVKDGDWYHDPGVPENDVTWLYGVVPLDFEFPSNIRYERLEDCYLSEHDPQTKSDGIDWAAVERESFRLTGNAAMLGLGTKAEDDAPRAPEGYITILDPDDPEGTVGVKGVRVCCNSFVKTAAAYTDENGHYKMSRTYSGELRFRLMFKNSKGFSQGLNHPLLPASVSALGKYPAEGCSVEIDNGSDYHLFVRSVLNNAGYEYSQTCEKSAGAIPKPPKDLRIWDLPLFAGSFNIMMHHGVIIDTFSPLHDVLGPLAMVARYVQPDVYFGIEGCASYSDAYARALLAFVQAGHFARVGKDWWHEYVLGAIGDGIVQSVTDLLAPGDAGDGKEEPEEAGAKNNVKSCAAGGSSTYAEIVQNYSNYCQTVLYRRHYPGSDALFGDRLNSPQIFLYLEERGLGLELLAPLFTSDVTDMAFLKQKMLSYYPQFKNVIMEAFARYEY